MPKAYWISTYRSISDPAALAEYAKLAGPAPQAGGGRFLARGTPAIAYEAGTTQRTVLIEFDDVEQAIDATLPKRLAEERLHGFRREQTAGLRLASDAVRQAQPDLELDGAFLMSHKSSPLSV